MVQEGLTLSLLWLAAMINVFIVVHISAYFIGRIIGKLLVCAVGTDIECRDDAGRSWVINLSGTRLWSLMSNIEEAQRRATIKSMRDIEGDVL